MVVNIRGDSEDWRARAISNFHISPFELDGVGFLSAEGFIQGIKFPEGDNNRLMGTILSGIQAKNLGKKAERKYVWWFDRKIEYGSDEHHRLIARGIIAKFSQDHDSMMALMMTSGEELTHDTGVPEDPNTSLPAELFCRILTKIRNAGFTEEI